MGRLVKFASVALLSMASVAPALAGPYADDLSKCLVKSSSADDQLTLMKWIFAALSAHPAVKPLANISDSQRTEFNAKAGALFERLVTKDCRTESVAALKYE